MKCLIVASCLFAVVSASLVGHSSYSYAPWAYQSAHIPVLDHNGYQLDTPEVAHAKAEHFAAHAEANARTGHGVYAHAVAPLAYAGHYATGLHQVAGVVHSGLPLDTPEVAHAKAAHLALFNEIAARNSVHYRKRRGLFTAPLAYAHSYAHAYPQHIPIIGHNGVPLETPEVVAAKAHHAAAHIEAKARNGDLHHVVAAPLAFASHGVHSVVAPLAIAHSHYHGPQHLPVIGPNGVPLDTPEVSAGKVANAVAHAEAHARNGDHLAVVAPVVHSYAAHVAPVHSYVSHVAPAVHAYTAPWSVAHHVPLVAHNGVPLDTPEVVAAKVHHAHAHAEARARNLHHY